MIGGVTSGIATRSAERGTGVFLNGNMRPSVARTDFQTANGLKHTTIHHLPGRRAEEDETNRVQRQPIPQLGDGLSLGDG